MTPPQLFTLLFGLMLIVLCIVIYLIALYDPATSKFLGDSGEKKNKLSGKIQELLVVVLPLDNASTLQAIVNGLSTFTFRDQQWQFTDVSPHLGLLRAMMHISDNTEYGASSTDVFIDMNVSSRFSSGAKSGDETVQVVYATTVAWTFDHGTSTADLTLGNSILQKELVTQTNRYIGEFLTKLEDNLRTAKHSEFAAGSAPTQLKVDLPTAKPEEVKQASVEISSGGKLSNSSHAAQNSIETVSSEILNVPVDLNVTDRSTVSFQSEQAAPAAAAAADEVFPSHVSKCPDCKKEIDPNFDFCLYCGHKTK